MHRTHRLKHDVHTRSWGGGREAEESLTPPVLPLEEGITAKLEIVSHNISLQLEQNKKVDQKLEKIICGSFEIRKENSLLRKKVIWIKKS